MDNSVGKKIVEALKMQAVPQKNDIYISEEPQQDIENTQNITEPSTPVSYNEPLNSNLIENVFSQSLSQNLGMDFNSQEEIDYPTNVAILKQLIAKLPSGVSKQTGALIIQQTMEALGISMSGVIQEAKQVQNTLNSRAKEAQGNIAEYKRQISLAENKIVQYQRQSVLLGDIINLFYQSGVHRG